MSISGLLRVTATAKRIPAKMTLREVGTWIYAPHEDPNRIHAADIDMAVVDYSFDGTDEGRVASDDMKRMRWGSDGSPRLILCRLSAAIADPRRPYWPLGGMPAWAVSQWKDGYVTNLMSREWRSILLEEVAKIRDAGFDGIFLECDYLLTAALDMADLVWQVRDQIKDLTLVVANGEYMTSISGFLGVVDGLARVGLYTTAAADSYEVMEVEDYLMQAEDKPIFVAEFTDDEDEALWARRCILEMGWNPCIVMPHGFA